jgi:hypothetical protein
VDLTAFQPNGGTDLIKRQPITVADGRMAWFMHHAFSITSVAVSA